MDDKEEIIKAIASVKGDIKVLKEKNEQLERSIFKDLKPEIKELCGKFEACMEKANEGYHKNFKWIVTTIISLVIGMMGWIGVAIMMFV